LAAQSTLERPPNLSGGWVTPAGRLQFNFVHRFSRVGEVNKVLASPTFLLAGGLPAGGLVGLVYATASDVAPANGPNEFELFGRWRPLASDGRPVAPALQLGYNFAARSLDGELSVRAAAGSFRFMGVARALSRPFARPGARVGLGAGGLWRPHPMVAVGGDVVTLLDAGPGESAAWSGGLLLAIPDSPHSLSIHFTNVNTGTLQGGSLGGSEARWGFEFTVPIELR